MEKTTGLKEEAFLWLFVLSWFVFLLLGSLFLINWDRESWIDWRCITGFIFSGMFLFFFAFFGLGGLTTTEEEDRAVTELFGAFHKVKGPGIIWVCPKLMRIRAIVPIWEQPIRLFVKEDEKGEEKEVPFDIDFEGGGTAKLVHPVLWGRAIRNNTKDPKDLEQRNRIDKEVLRRSVYHMTYGIDDWKVAARENVETAFRTRLNNLRVEEALHQVFAREEGELSLSENWWDVFNERFPGLERARVEEVLRKVLSQTEKTDFPPENWWDVLNKHFPNLGETMRSFGFEATRLTVTDLAWDKDVITERQKVFREDRSIKIAELSVQAARNEVLQRALESGGWHGEIVRILTEDPNNYDKEKAIEVATELVTHFKSAETKRLVHVKSSGPSGATSLIADLFATAHATKQQFLPAGQPEKESKGESEEGS